MSYSRWSDFNILLNNRTRRVGRSRWCEEYSIREIENRNELPFSFDMNLKDNINIKFISNVEDLDNYVMLKKLIGEENENIRINTSY